MCCDSLLQVKVRYRPLAMGSHPSTVQLDVLGENSNVVVQTLSLQVSASLRASVKTCQQAPLPWLLEP